MLLITTVVVVAILWPLPELSVPNNHDQILIESVNIVDVKNGKILYDHDILIENNKITSISETWNLNNSVDLRINGQGKYVIPGLWDMHTHSNQQSPWLHHPLYIANGVTGIRDMSGQLNVKDSYWVGSIERLMWNAELNANKRVMPRYVLQSSYQIDGVSSVPDGFPEFFKIENPNQVDSLLQYYKNEHVDFIKVYQQIPVASYRKLAYRAEYYNLHLAGHKPMFLSLEEAIDLGQRSFEHGRIFLFESFPEADSLKNPKNWKRYFSKHKRKLVDEHDPKVTRALMQSMQSKNAHWVPTLQTLKFEALAHDKTFLSNPNLKYITRIRKKLWWNMDAKNNTKKNNAEDTKGVSQDFYNMAMQHIEIANNLGVPIMAGTDVTDSYTFAGFSIHDELEDLTKSGLTNLEALQSATIIPAEFVQNENLYGSIEIGKVADLVLLEGNPLESISHSRKIHGVLMNGLYFDSERIESLKDFSESSASSFHMNIKVLFSLISSPLVRVQFAD